VQVLVYALSTCPWCRKTKRYLAEHGIPFQVVDYDLQTPEEQAKMEALMLERGGAISFPWVLFGDTVVVGWNPEEYARLLGLD
jgi:glutaredoxin